MTDFDNNENYNPEFTKPEAPEIPETPEIPEAPEAPEVPETPEIPEAPEAPEVIEAPEAPEVPETPETPAAEEPAFTAPKAPEQENIAYTYSYGQGTPYAPRAAAEEAPVQNNAPRTAEELYGRPVQFRPDPYSASNAQTASSAASAPVSPAVAQRTVENAPQTPAPQKKAKKKKKGTIKTSTAILLCIACVILAFALSLLGSALIYKNMSANNTENTAETGKEAENEDNPGVIIHENTDPLVNGDTSVSDIADIVADSVVEIRTEFVTNNNYFFGQYVSKGAGSGVIVSEDGYIITNNHVICDTDNNNKQADKISVRIRTGEEYTATVIGTDSDADIALIKVDATDLKAAVWADSDTIVVGQQVVAVGNPLGELGGTLTVGYISATTREIEIDGVNMTLIQTDAAVNPGNSGGGLFDLGGRLIGIVNAKSSGTGVEGLGFAIPANDAKDTMSQLLEYGYVKGKAYIGVYFYEYNSGYYSFGGASEGMLVVYGCEEGFNDKVLESGNIVLTVDGKEVSTVADVRDILKQHKVGDKLTFSILRNKTAMDVEVECFEYEPASDESVQFEQQ